MSMKKTVEKGYPWNRDYPIPDELKDSSYDENAGMAGWRTERLKNPDEVFIDIYGLLDHLTSSGNLQARGRRGTGKTMYFIKSQHKLGQLALEKHHQQIVSSYIDLKSINNFHEIPSIILRAEYLFREVIRDLFLTKEPERGIKRYILRDYIFRVDIARKWMVNREINSLFRLIKNQGEKLLPEQQESIITEREQDILLVNKNLPIKTLLSGSNSYNTSLDINREFIKNLRVIDQEFFGETHIAIARYLQKILSILKIEKFILFLDEFSSPVIYQPVQVLLIDRLMKIFDGEKMSFKIASVPGTTIVYNDFPLGSMPNNSNAGFDTFDFEAQAMRKPSIIRTGIFEIFLRNLGNSDRFYRIYTDDPVPENGFNNFISDTFQKPSDFQEFIKAGDGLPRQMLETFHNANTIKKSINPNGKLNGNIIQLASKQSLQIVYQSQIRGSSKCEDVLSRIYKINSRVLKIERHPEYAGAIDLLTHWGFIHACPITPTHESAISKFPFHYYYTSYRTEVANQLSRNKIVEYLVIEDLAGLEKDKLKELYPKAKPIIFSDNHQNYY